VIELKNAKRVTELTERTRIAQDIHDHVGHEISGALIALQTAVILYEKGDMRTGELLTQTVSRLESASANLRETVYNLKPVKESGIEMLQELCDGFEFCKVKFTVSGESDSIKCWDLLNVTLKEALTNISRHSKATQATVKLDVNVKFIRVEVYNDGKCKKEMKYGLGLTGMKERVRAANGMFTVNTDNGFKIICVIPKGVSK
jgi:signal transduction histidine kinase